MANVRAMVVLQGGSNLPEDRFINTFHFSNGDAYPAHVVNIQEALADFYIEEVGPAPDAVGNYISPYAARAAQIVTYNLADPEPRVPTTVGLTLPAATGNGGPEEAAAVLSFHGGPPITGRRRGRVFLGPLTLSAYSQGTTGSPTRLAGALIGTMAAAGSNLILAGVGWAIRSVASGGTFVPVVGGWVDNAIDTQRRRGPDATARTNWP